MRHTSLPNVKANSYQITIPEATETDYTPYLSDQCFYRRYELTKAIPHLEQTSIAGKELLKEASNIGHGHGRNGMRVKVKVR